MWATFERSSASSEEVAMRIGACGLIAGAALLGAAPVAMADIAVSERVSTTTGTSFGEDQFGRPSSAAV